MKHVTVALASLAMFALPLSPASAAPTGNPAAYKVFTAHDLNSGREVVVRWNPCRGIRVKINPGPYGQAGLSEAKKAVVMAARASGLRFVYAGTTNYVPRRSTSPDQRAKTGADLVVGFADPRSAYLRGAPGRGGWSGDSDAETAYQIVDGTAFVAASPRLAPGFGPSGLTRGNMLLHEIGHAVGLDHVRDRAQVMGHGRSGEYQRGDLSGLSKVGRPAGCIVSKPRDRDRDGIPDRHDQDPDDPKNPSTTDTDGDGTVDARDDHPNDPYRDGMGKDFEDADGDGVLNYEDPAPGDPTVPARASTATPTATTSANP